MQGQQSVKDAYYIYQTKARGLLDVESLQRRFVKLRPWYRHLLKRFLPKSKDAAILDAPCGYGNVLYFLREEGYRNVIGYDLDIEQVRLAQLLELPAFQNDVFDIYNKNMLYDCIVSVDFLEHLSRDEAFHFLQLCYENLNAEGTLIVRTPCADGLFGASHRYNDLTHQWGMTSTVLRILLQMTGFANVNILDERPQPYNLINCLRLLMYYPVKLLTSIWLITLGIEPPEIWSKSMWAVAKKI